MNDDHAQAWNYYVHFDNLLATRINFLLVAESMLVAAFVTIPPNNGGLRFLISVLAIIYTVSLFYLNLRLAGRRKVLADKLTKYSLFGSFVKSGPKRPNVTDILCYVLPISTLLFWAFLLSGVM